MMTPQERITKYVASKNLECLFGMQRLVKMAFLSVASQYGIPVLAL